MQVHIEEILSLDVMQYQSLFLEIGEALLKRDMWEKALDCFAAIQECEGVGTV
jgi:general transcription factor 3C polypeptide 3 (transcription factor C subunit 4)